MIGEKMMPQYRPENGQKKSLPLRRDNMPQHEAEKLHQERSALLYRAYDHVGDDLYFTEITRQLFENFFPCIHQRSVRGTSCIV